MGLEISCSQLLLTAFDMNLAPIIISAGFAIFNINTLLVRATLYQRAVLQGDVTFFKCSCMLRITKFQQQLTAGPQLK